MAKIGISPNDIAETTRKSVPFFELSIAGWRSSRTLNRIGPKNQFIEFLAVSW